MEKTGFNPRPHLGGDVFPRSGGIPNAADTQSSHSFTTFSNPSLPELKNPCQSGLEDNVRGSTP